MRPAHLVVYSDFLCPWCWNAAMKLASVQAQLGDDLAIEWRSYLLRLSALVAAGHRGRMNRDARSSR